MSIVLAFLTVYQVFWAPNTFESDRFITVSKGESFAHVTISLEQDGIIRNRLLFDIAGRMLKFTTTMQIGKYRFTSGMSNKEILEDLHYGKTIEFIVVNIPEGLRATKHARIFARTLGIDSARYVSLVFDSSFTRGLNIPARSLEGYLMPSSYLLFWQMDEAEIIKAQVNEFWRVFNDTLQETAERMGETTHDVVTLASIVENETHIDTERAIIAGVYLNRLEKGMRLEADPTIQYIIGDSPRRLYNSDLELESAYNTYRHYGLPPGPINNPGKASFLAALFPQKSKYLFFVATGQGGHAFSRTYQDHQKAVGHYRKFRKLQEALRQEG